MTNAAYRLYYWPLPFRGNFVELMLNDIGASYQRADMDALLAIKTAPVTEQGVPGMAPPYLECLDSGFWINQMPAIMTWLADRHHRHTANPDQSALALKIVTDCNDVLGDLTRANGSQMWDADAWADFRSTRLPRWLEILEETTRRNGGANGYLFGAGQPGVGDFALAALLGTLHHCLAELRPDIQRHAPDALALALRVENRPAPAEFLTRQRAELGSLYCGGQIEASIREMLS